MKLISWNVNGLRACMDKGFLSVFQEMDADIFCIQETKMQPEQANYELPGYRQYWNSAVKKGYSGTAVFTRREPLSIRNGIGEEALPDEGRVITLEFDRFYLVNVYAPNSQQGLKRLATRMAWEDAFRRHVKELDAQKPVVICGDLNVAHQEMDLKNYKTNRGSAGFSDEEREKLSSLLAEGFTDTFRFLHPDEIAYTWWSYRFRAREKNAGWRIDYFLVSDRLRPQLLSASVYADVLGSDHCPVGLELSDTPAQ